MLGYSLNSLETYVAASSIDTKISAKILLTRMFNSNQNKKINFSFIVDCVGTLKGIATINLSNEEIVHVILK